LVESSVERRQLEHETQASVYVRCNEGSQEQEEQPDVMVTGKTVPTVVPSGVRSSDSQLSCMNVRVNESTQIASMEHGDDNSWNCRSNNLLPPGRGNERIIGRTELSLTASGGARTSANSSTLDSSTARQQQSSQYSGSSSNSQRQNLHDSELVVRSQFDDLSVCTRVDGKNDFLRCNDGDDGPERTFTRQTAARIRGHPPGESHSQPPSVRGSAPDSQDTIANYRTVMCTSDTENVDDTIRPRPVQPQPTACGLDRHHRPVALVNQSVQPGNMQLIDKLSGSDVLLAHTSTLQRQDTLPWPPGQEDAPRPVYTQPTYPARKLLSAMHAGDASPGSEDVPMPICRPTGTQIYFQPRQTISVSAQQVTNGDKSLPARLCRATGVHTEPLTGQVDQMSSADLTSHA